uniref:Sortilin-related receptor-like n=1 Tax=Saccoglossus kowalevskii TaxID=10224 RepID=A0ABM0M9V2_SACKO
MVTKYELPDDHHNEMIVHWAGEGSKVIVALTRDETTQPVSTSQVYFSMDYGVSFSKKQITGKIDPTLWKSEDFGESWVKIQDNVKSFWWGVEPDPATRLYIERQEPGQTSTVLYSDDYFSSQRTESILLQGIEDFEVRDEYLFATRKRMIEGQADYTLELLVSHERGDFQQAEFPNELLNLDFYIADASEHQVFVCVNHDRSLNTGITHLYISESAGVRFSLSLENVVYFNPQGPGKDTWLSYYSDQPFADIHKVEGLRGIYIASQFNDTQGGTFQDKNMVSLITFDKGGEWSRLNEPQRDSQGKPYPDCGILNSCSLHLTQKFSLLYPRSRTVPILSKKSAPGLIMASGTVGTSIKDNPAVFISTTAGVEWFEVLKDNYYYAFGDHGGLIVAVKQYGPTDEIRYSWNEGETWNTLTFSEEQIQVYDVMTEPGEHTTVFTLFGSSVGKQHTWMIVQVNLSSIFEYSCTDDDYKLWSPCEELADACLLGSKTVYERRIAHAKCYNGKDYDRPVSTVLCPCTREDYECDFGYKEIFEWNPTCVPDPESDIDPHAIPVPCHEGNFYTRSRGYRKVSGDLCTGGVEMRLDPERVSCPVSENPEFILYAMRTEVRRYILGDQRQETLPLQGLQNVIAVDFDYKDNFIYWADMATDKIMRYGLNGYGEHEVIVTGQLDTIEALSFDWLSGNIYWVDSGSKKIEVCRKNGINRRELFNASHSLDNPRALSLDPRRGWMYWTDWGDKPHIRRAHMDGLYHEIIISENIHWPNGIVVDDHTQKLFWTDAYFDRIETAYFDGSSRQVLLSHDIPHPYAIGVYKDEIYWDDWYKRAISKASKYDGSGVTIVEDNLDSVMDLKILAKSTQQGSNPCATNNGGCSQLCLVKPIGDDGGVGRTCKCGHDTEVVVYHGTDEECRCKGGETIINGTCVPQNGKCIPASWHCDKDNDCGDSSDEQDCPYQTCHPDEFTCGNGRCISGSWQCDLDNDCYDWSDEQGCDYPTCGVDKFTCDNQRCIPITWRCDYDNDCRDNSDEMNCNYNNYTDSTEPGTCNKNQMTCDNGLCIPSNWRCDGYDDCGDNSDEPDSCQQRECNSSFEFKCKNNNCIYLSWKCDGMDDCGDNSDEQNCQDVVTTSAPSTSYPSSCNTWQFSCLNGNCVSYWWKCDGVNDCGDYSDEYDCGPVTNETSTTTKSYTQYYTCSPYEFECGPLATTRCIPSYWVCDGDNDCGDYSDENACPSPVYVPTTTTPPPRCTRDKFRCYDGHCLPRIYICNGYWDCVSGEDERNC